MAEVSMKVSRQKIGNDRWFVAEGFVNDEYIKGYSVFSHKHAIINALECRYCGGNGYYTVNAGKENEYEQKCRCRKSTGEEDNRDR